MKGKNEYTKSFIKVLVFTVWPFLSFYAYNQQQSPTMSSLNWLLIIAIVLVSIILIIALKASFFSVRQASDALAIFIVLFFQYKLIKASLIDFGFSPITSNTLCFLLIILPTIGVYFLSVQKVVSKSVLAMGMVLISVPLVQIALYSTQPVEKMLVISDEFLSFPPKIRPNIYYIVLDGYVRNDLLKEYYKYDNSPFTGELEKYGFRVASQAMANYPLTYLSISSSLQLEYLLRQGDSVVNRNSFYQILGGNNRLIKYLKDYEYSYIHFEMESGVVLDVLHMQMYVSMGQSGGKT